MTWLFTIALLAICAGIALTAQTIRKQNATVTRTGPVPGYSCTPGVNVDLEPMTNGYGALRWTVERLEEFHSQGRTRLILTLSLESDPGAGLDDAMVEVAKLLLGRVNVDLVVVEAGSRRLLYAPDGLGWSGEGEGSLYFASQ